MDCPRFCEKSRQWFETGACFVAGTLVHTKEGLVPIEQIKVSDLVLSRSENPNDGEELAYKRVSKIFVHHDKEVMNIQCSEKINWLPGKKEFFDLFVTFDHPFWVEGEGWTAAAKLKNNFYGRSKLHLLNRADGFASPARVYQTGQEGIGWIGAAGWQGDGALWNFDENRYLDTLSYFDTYQWPWDENGDIDGEGYVYKTTVYNIEVEDYHTYFVGEKGVWVHNANCDITLFNKNGQHPDITLLGERQLA
ncbi:hypothetical protein AGMMS50256_11300 [Betaproteobacteria bacterium]|nr:hypothetical protein AGMMS50256_11300 [Betaproteobacteria bacterium]